MKETNSMFAKVDSLVDVLNVEPSFLKIVNVKSMIPRSHGILINYMNHVMYYMNNNMCSVYTVVCCVQNVMYDGSLMTTHSIILLLGKIYSLSCMSLVCTSIYPYIIQVCTNPIQF